MKDSLIKAYVLLRVGINQGTTPGPRDEQKGRHGDTKEGEEEERKERERGRKGGRRVKCV